MDRKDFDNNIDWVVYKVTGKVPVSPTPTYKLENHVLQGGVNELKFYTNNQNDRYGCLYDNTFICSCEKDEMHDVQKYFDEHYNGKNLNEIIGSLKSKYNLSIRNQTYKNGTLRFEKRGKRLNAQINHNRKTHSICSCYPNQKDEVIEKFNTLRETRNLDEIKRIMKSEYNIQGRKSKTSKDDVGVISLDKNGTIYKDGKLCKIDPKVYEFVDSFIQK